MKNLTNESINETKTTVSKCSRGDQHSSCHICRVTYTLNPLLKDDYLFCGILYYKKANWGVEINNCKKGECIKHFLQLCTSCLQVVHFVAEPQKPLCF